MGYRTTVYGSELVPAVESIGAAVANAGGLSSNKLATSTATTNATVVKSSAGRLYKIRGYNNKASVVYLKLYNKATAPTVGTDVPVVTIPCKAADVICVDLGDIGQYFSAGISYAITGAAADNDTTAVAAGDVTGLMVWYA